MPGCLSREHYMRGQAKTPSLWMLTRKSRGDSSLVAQQPRIVPVFPCKHMQTEAHPFTLSLAVVCTRLWTIFIHRCRPVYLSMFGGWTPLHVSSCIVNGEHLYLNFALRFKGALGFFLVSSESIALQKLQVIIRMCIVNFQKHTIDIYFGESKWTELNQYWK